MKQINEQLLQVISEANEDIEWIEEDICTIEPLPKDILETLNEFFIDTPNMYGVLPLEEAVDTMSELYHAEKVGIIIPTTTKFNYKGNTYELCLVMGNCTYTNNKLKCKYGVKHILDRHSKENVTVVDKQSLSSEKALLQAMKELPDAIANGRAYIDKKNPDRLAFVYKEFLYILFVTD